MPAPIDLHEVAERELSERYRFPWRVKACMSTACLSAGAGPAFAAMEQTIEKEDLALEALQGEVLDGLRDVAAPAFVGLAEPLGFDDGGPP